MHLKITKYSTEYLGLTCDIQTLNDMIGMYIDVQEFSFSFRDLYNHIKRISEENHLFQKEYNVEYTFIGLRNDVVQLITKYLRERIWNKELMIDFSNRDMHSMHSNDDYWGYRVNNIYMA